MAMQHFMHNLLLVISLLVAYPSSGQTIQPYSHPYRVSIEPIHSEQLIGLQSYAVGQWQKHWVCIGGRADGLHERQPFASFDEDGAHIYLTVYNISEDRRYSVAIDHTRGDLPPTLDREVLYQLSSSNMQYAQYEDYLILIGGYGLQGARQHVTFDRAIIFHLPTLVQMIKSDGDWWRSIVSVQQDKAYEVCGGRMLIIDNRLFLVGGHSFMGSYNPDGPDSGPGFVQQYTNAVRYIDIIPTPAGHISLALEKTITDDTLLHKRDYNLLPYYDVKDKSYRIMALSGVFRHDVDIPWLDNISISHQDTARVRSRKFFNQYHCPGFSLYDRSRQENVQYLFGGISQYDIESGVLTNDYNVPFTTQISAWVGDKYGDWSEHLLQERMPLLVGAGAEFIPNTQHNYWHHGVLLLHRLPKHKKTLIGYIYGGIASDSSNIFWINDGSQSRAYPGIFKVYIDRSEKQEMLHNAMSDADIYYEVYPYIGSEVMTIDYTLLRDAHTLSYQIKTTSGKVIHEEILRQNKTGSYQEKIKIKGIGKGAVLFVDFEKDGKKYSQKIKIDKNID